MISKKSAFKINDVMMYVAVAVEHLRLMILLIVMCLTMGLVYYCFARPVYYSRSLVVLHTLPQKIDTQEVYHDSSREAIYNLLESDAILERTAKRFGHTESAKELRKIFLKRTRLSFTAEGNIVLEVYPYKVEWARDLPEEMVKQCLLYRAENRRTKLYNIYTTYTTEMADMRQMMDKMLSGKLEFSQSNDLAHAQLALDGLQSIPLKLKFLNARLEKMDEISKRLETTADPSEKLALLASEKTDSLYDHFRDLEMQAGGAIRTDGVSGGTGHGSGIVILPSDVSKEDSRWEKLSGEIRALESEIAVLTKAGYLSGSSKIRKPAKELAHLRAEIDQELAVELKHFRMEQDNLQEERKTLEAKYPAFEEASRSYARLQREVTMYDSQQLSWSGMIDDMQRRLNMMDFGVGKEHITVTFNGTEPVKTIPDSPNRGKVAIMSLGFGFALAIAIPFLLAYLDNSVTDVEHVEEILKIRGLGVVPRVEDVSINNLLVANINAKPAARPEYHLQENFRIIRTNLIMNSADPAMPQVILITSAMPQEGKTVVAANLAMSFAIKGEKTLLVDGDLRRGRLHRLFNCQNKPGLSDVLSKYNSLSEACRPSGNENLTIMTCGKHLNWASELLDSPGYAKIIEELRSQYQRIIIDTPPVLGLSETSIMQRLCDGVLMVIWSNATQMPNVKDAISALQTNGAQFCGFVLNRLDFNAFANRYKYFYYSPRYYTNYKAIEADPLGAEG